MVPDPAANRPSLLKALADPVVVGLGRLLITLGVLLLVALLSVVWLLLRGVT